MVVFTEVLLTEDSQKILRDLLVDLLPAPEGAREFLHHLTLGFKPPQSEVVSLPFGAEVEVAITGLFRDRYDRRIAAFCASPKGVESSNPLPHVTAWAKEGVSPVAANAMLEEEIGYRGGDDNFLLSPLIVKGVVSWFDGEEHRQDQP